MLTKDSIRNVMRKRRASLEAGWVLTQSRYITARVLVLPEFQRAEVVLGYLSLPGEVNVEGILAAAWKAGKRVAVPAVRDDGEYMPAWLTPNESLTHGGFNVRQPVAPFWAKPDAYGLVVVPGVAFAANGARLGHGKGFYDRMLARLGTKVLNKVGVCFSFQLAPELPVTETDVGMDVVVTEDQVYRKG
ncbi:MAG: 5-formyltetrahydrofolate cyclo-ligase [bacterium]|jgi:5-formyltetrahydrofolate cyclo-ligase